MSPFLGLACGICCWFFIYFNSVMFFCTGESHTFFTFTHIQHYIICTLFTRFINFFCSGLWFGLISAPYLFVCLEMRCFHSVFFSLSFSPTHVVRKHGFCAYPEQRNSTQAFSLGLPAGLMTSLASIAQSFCCKPTSWRITPWLLFRAISGNGR
jgi:hypothetical protein